MPSAAESHEINWIGNMSTFSISENNESLLSNCRTQKMYRIVNKHIDFLTTQIVGTVKSAYSKDYAQI